jgi:hypothetical protein
MTFEQSKQFVFKAMQSSNEAQVRKVLAQMQAAIAQGKTDFTFVPPQSHEHIELDFTITRDGIVYHDF